MRKYELVCIFQPELDENAFKAALERVQTWITNQVAAWTRPKFGAGVSLLI